MLKLTSSEGERGEHVLRLRCAGFTVCSDQEIVPRGRNQVPDHQRRLLKMLHVREDFSRRGIPFPGGLRFVQDYEKGDRAAAAFPRPKLERNGRHVHKQQLPLSWGDGCCEEGCTWLVDTEMRINWYCMKPKYDVSL